MGGGCGIMERTRESSTYNVGVTYNMNAGHTQHSTRRILMLRRTMMMMTTRGIKRNGCGGCKSGTTDKYVSPPQP